MSQSYIYGFHAISKMLQHSLQSCVELLCTEGKNPRLLSLIANARQSRLPVRFESRELLTDLSGSAKHQGCVLQIIESSPTALTLEQLLQQNHQRSLYLVLDGVQDPHNLGACLRTADATGVDAVIIPKNRSAYQVHPLPKKASGFSPVGFDWYRLLPGLNISGPISPTECYCQHKHQFFDLVCICDMRVFYPESSSLKATKQGFDFPTSPIHFHWIPELEIRGNNHRFLGSLSSLD